VDFGKIFEKYFPQNPKEAIEFKDFVNKVNHLAQFPPNLNYIGYDYLVVYRSN